MASKNLRIYSLVGEEIHINQVITEININLQLVSAIKEEVRGTLGTFNEVRMGLCVKIC